MSDPSFLVDAQTSTHAWTPNSISMIKTQNPCHTLHMVLCYLGLHKAKNCCAHTCARSRNSRTVVESPSRDSSSIGYSLLPAVLLEGGRWFIIRLQWLARGRSYFHPLPLLGCYITWRRRSNWSTSTSQSTATRIISSIVSFLYSLQCNNLLFIHLSCCRTHVKFSFAVSPVARRK